MHRLCKQSASWHNSSLDISMERARDYRRGHMKDKIACKTQSGGWAPRGRPLPGAHPQHVASALCPEERVGRPACPGGGGGLGGWVGRPAPGTASIQEHLCEERRGPGGGGSLQTSKPGAGTSRPAQSRWSPPPAGTTGTHGAGTSSTRLPATGLS